MKPPYYRCPGCGYVAEVSDCEVEVRTLRPPGTVGPLHGSARIRFAARCGYDGYELERITQLDHDALTRKD